MFQMTKNCRKAMVTCFVLIVFCISVMMNISAAEETQNTHKLTYMLDGSVWQEQEYQEGERVETLEAPKKENFIFAEWKNMPETMPASDVTVTGVYNFDGTLVTDLDQVYACDLVVSDEIAVTMYLRINKEGNFVFSRSTDFSQAEKGAGKVYKKSEKAVITSGEYAVDISWSPMQGMFEPVLNIDAENMTFQLYNDSEPETGKGNGTIAYADGVYTMNFTDGNTTTFTCENDIISFTSKLWYGSASFERKDDQDTFIPYEAELTNENSRQEEAQEEDEETSIAPGTYCLVYYVVNDENVALGEHVTTFEIEENGNLQITSPFWFGATTPQFVADDGTVTYPEFIVSDKAIEKDIDASVILSKEEKEEEKQAGEQENETSDLTGFKTGTYGGTYTTTAMGSSLTYACTITFQADGSYQYTVKFNLMGKTYTESESGTYKVNGSSLTLISGKGGSMSGSVNGNSVSITRKVSSYAFSAATITLTYGYTPGVTASNANPGAADQDKETEKQTENTKETETNKAPVTGEGGLLGGEYQVDISWSPMAAMMSPVLNIDAEKMTFHIYHAATPNTDKGNGTVTYKNGVYTLHYSTGKTTTFTFRDKVITFTSALYYGTASFNQTNGSGAFVPYTAKLGKSQTTDKPSKEPETEPETESESETESERETEKQPDTETETEAPQLPAVKMGTYTGTYEKTAMGQKLVYQFVMELKEDGTYTHSVSYTMMGNEYSESETGTYQIEGAQIILTNEKGVVMNGTIGEKETISVTRKASAMASSDVEILYTFGTSGGGSGQETEAPTESEDKPEAFKTGTYGGNYSSTTAMGTTNYAYTLRFQEDGSYQYQAGFVMGDTTYTHTESGTYETTEDGFTLTSNGYSVTDANGETALSSAAAQTMAGKIVDGQAVSVTRKVSGFARSDAELSLTYGYAPTVEAKQKAVKKSKAAETEVPEEPASEKESEPESAEITEAQTESETEKVTETETNSTEAEKETETTATEKKEETEAKATEGKEETAEKATERKEETEAKATERKEEITEKKEKPESKTEETEEKQ